MSLGNFTQCDLNFDVAKVDMKALEEQLRYHFFTLATTIHDKAGDIIHVLTTKEQREAVFSTSSTGGRRMINLAQQLAKTSELLHAIQETPNRAIEPVNLLEGDK